MSLWQKRGSEQDLVLGVDQSATIPGENWSLWGLSSWCRWRLPLRSCCLELEVRRSQVKPGHVSEGENIGAGLVRPGLVDWTSQVVTGTELRVHITPAASSGVWSGAVTLQYQPRSQRVLHSHWSRSNEALLSLVERFRVLKYFHSVASLTILCHKEPRRAIKKTSLFFGCPSWFFMA